MSNHGFKLKRIHVENLSVITTSCQSASVTRCLHSEEWRRSLNSRVKRKEEGHVPKFKIIIDNDLVWVLTWSGSWLGLGSGGLDYNTEDWQRMLQRNVCFCHQRATLHVRRSSYHYHVSSSTLLTKLPRIHRCLSQWVVSLPSETEYLPTASRLVRVLSTIVT